MALAARRALVVLVGVAVTLTPPPGVLGCGAPSSSPLDRDPNQAAAAVGVGGCHGEVSSAPAYVDRPATGNADTTLPGPGLFHYGMPGPFYSLAQFPKFRLLLDHWQEIRDEAVAIQGMLNLRRKQNEWGGGTEGANFVQQLIENENRGWIIAWDGDGLWVNYALMYFNNVVPGVTEQWAPRTIALLRQIPGVRVGGFSKLLPHAYIAPHKDSTGPAYHSMAFHLCLTGHASLRVEEHWVEQAPGKTLLFDSTRDHEVKNGNEERIVLYLDFDTDVFLNETEGVDLLGPGELE
jgi:hypothetical protein